MTATLPLAYVLIALGFLLMVTELFLFTHGVLFALAAVCIAIGVGITFTYDPSMGWITLIAVFASMPVVGWLASVIWPKTAIGKRFFLKVPAEDETLAAMPVNLELEQLRGRLGRALAPMLPSGMVDFDGRRVDCMTEGLMVEAGEWVRCVDVQAGKVIVRPVPKADLGDLDTADFR